MSSIMLVEDDLPIAASLSLSLRESGHAVSHFATGAAAMGAVLEGAPDAILLDLGLPDMDGSTLLIMIRAVSRCPIIVVTARDQNEEVIRLLNLGADDYVVKPVHVAQLDARIKAVLRRAAPEMLEDLRVGSLTVSPGRREAFLEGRQLVLRPRAFDILLFLAHHAGQIVRRQDLVREIWGAVAPDADGRLDVHLSSIRAALGETGRHQRYLQTIRGIGVRLDESGATR